MLSFEQIANRLLHEHARQEHWTVQSRTAGEASWILFTPQAPAPLITQEQGWKLHVTSSVENAERTLFACLPILLGNKAPFKIAASAGDLSHLNNGYGGLSQIGKFITIYPTNDVEAHSLANLIHSATLGIPGPAVPSDRRFRQGGSVYYRYGGFSDLVMQTLEGETVPALRDPEGRLVPDLRTSRYVTPLVPDPFLSKGRQEEEPHLIVAGRYLKLAVLHASARGYVYMGLDMTTLACCVLKQATLQTTLGVPSREPWEALQREFDFLRLMNDHDGFPQQIDWVQEDGNVYLVMQHVEGRTLEEEIQTRKVIGALPGPGEVLSWARQLISLVQDVHSAGAIYRDLKSTNIIIDHSRSLWLVDFDSIWRPGLPIVAGSGTRGYRSPQQLHGAIPTPQDDIFSLGAILYFITTGAEPSQAPLEENLLSRSISTLNDVIPPQLIRVVTKCLDPDTTSRYSSLVQVMADLSKADLPLTTSTLPAVYAENGEGRNRIIRGVLNVADSLMEHAIFQEHEEGHIAYWRSRHPVTFQTVARDVNAGVAGDVLALAEFVQEFGLAQHRKILEEAARGLRLSRPTRPNDPLPGLYVGEAGVSAALLRAGQVLGTKDLLEAAELLSVQVGKTPHGSPDMFVGTAGRIRLHLMMFDETGADEQLLFALAAGRRLVEIAERTADELCWPLPEASGILKGSTYIGYAHGAAGIGDVLLDLYEETDEAEFKAAAEGAGRWIMRQAINTDAGLAWPSQAAEPPAAPYWCHGSAGIAKFLLHAGRLNILPGASAYATKALALVAAGTRWSSPTLCHGLSGSVDALLDGFQATGEDWMLAEALRFGELILDSARTDGDVVVWDSDEAGITSPDYLVGYAGTGVAMLRLIKPSSRPSQLTRAGFRYGMKQK